MLEEPDEALMKQYGITSILQQTRVTTERLDKLTQLIEQGVVFVHVEKTFPLDQAAEALYYLEHTPPQGKVVINVKEQL
ncbi:zinc-binding dehydrogenase [Candidatus Microgenomates bacterium]|nr:zinc-binding dehydrogenase [Candidatus Microgenomates bacterium]